MKTKIDNLVRGILDALASPSPDVPEVAAYLEAIGADNLSKAIEQRAILMNWTVEMSLPADMRQYAQQQLETLPAF